MTPRQLEALDAVRVLADAGIDATVRDVQRRLELRSTHTAHKLLTSLVESGHLTRREGKKRGLVIAGRPDLRIASTDALKAELARRGAEIGALDVPQRRAVGREVTCAADTCGMAVQRGHLMCRRHWLALPPDLRTAILAAHRARDVRRYQALVAEARDIADACGGVL